jgi:hypothetical protein
VNSWFALLVRHFITRFFDNDIVAASTDMRTNMVQAIGLAATPGMMFAFYLLPQNVRFDQPFAWRWGMVMDCYFFVLYSMLVMGLVMVLEWDALFPDRSDYLILTPLPLPANAIFLGKSAALLGFLAIFLLAGNALALVLAPMMMSGPHAGLSQVLGIVWAHAIGVFGAGAFMALAFAALEGVLINILTARAFRRISPGVQMGAMMLVITVLFLTPLECSLMQPLITTGHPFTKWFPPFWFLGLYLDSLPGHPAGAAFHQLALYAWRSLGVSGTIFVVTYLAGYRRHARRVMTSIDTAAGPALPRRIFERAVNRWLLPHPLERATFHFISNTILRNARQRLFLALYAGVALALALPSVLWAGASHGTPRLIFLAEGMAAVPLTLTFFTVTGLRAAFNFPAELRANWIFQTAESEESYLHLRAVRKWVVTMALVPLTLLLAPWEIYVCGWPAGLVHITFAFVLSLLTIAGLLVWFRKIPFTCSYFPGKTAMALTALIYLVTFITYSWTMRRLEDALMRAPFGLVLFYLFGFLALIALSLLERRELGIDSVLIYDDQPEPAVRTLEIG